MPKGNRKSRELIPVNTVMNAAVVEEYMACGRLSEAYIYLGMLLERCQQPSPAYQHLLNVKSLLVRKMLKRLEEQEPPGSTKIKQPTP